MNIAQLERLRHYIRAMREWVDSDISGVEKILDAINDMDHIVVTELKVLVWKQYEEAKD